MITNTYEEPVSQYDSEVKGEVAKLVGKGIAPWAASFIAAVNVRERHRRPASVIVPFPRRKQGSPHDER